MPSTPDTPLAPLHLGQLPTELLEHILSFVDDLGALAALARASRTLHALLARNNAAVWRGIARRVLQTKAVSHVTLRGAAMKFGAYAGGGGGGGGGDATRMSDVWLATAMDDELALDCALGAFEPFAGVERDDLPFDTLHRTARVAQSIKSDVNQHMRRLSCPHRSKGIDLAAQLPRSSLPSCRAPALFTLSRDSTLRTHTLERVSSPDELQRLAKPRARPYAKQTEAFVGYERKATPVSELHPSGEWYKPRSVFDCELFEPRVVMPFLHDRVVSSSGSRMRLVDLSDADAPMFASRALPQPYRSLSFATRDILLAIRSAHLSLLSLSAIFENTDDSSSVLKESADLDVAPDGPDYLYPFMACGDGSQLLCGRGVIKLVSLRPDGGIVLGSLAHKEPSFVEVWYDNHQDSFPYNAVALDHTGFRLCAYDPVQQQFQPLMRLPKPNPGAWGVACVSPVHVALFSHNAFQLVDVRRTAGPLVSAPPITRTCSHAFSDGRTLVMRNTHNGLQWLPLAPLIGAGTLEVHQL